MQARDEATARALWGAAHVFSSGDWPDRAVASVIENEVQLRDDFGPSTSERS